MARSRKKGFRRIDEDTVSGEHQIRHYENRFVRRVRYRLKPIPEEELEILKHEFPDFLKFFLFKKLVPNAEVKEDDIIYKCPKKPTIYFHVRKGTLKIPTQEYERYEKAVRQNQGHFFIDKIKECANFYQIDYIDVRYLKRRVRYRKRLDMNIFKDDKNENSQN